MHLRLLTLALVSCVLFVAAPAMAQDGTYTSTTPTTSTPTESTPAETTTESTEVAPQVAAESDSGAPAGELASTGGGNTWLLLGIGGALVAGSALVLVLSRERRSDNHR